MNRENENKRGRELATAEEHADVRAFAEQIVAGSQCDRTLHKFARAYLDVTAENKRLQEALELAGRRLRACADSMYGEGSASELDVDCWATEAIGAALAESTEGAMATEKERRNAEAKDTMDETDDLHGQLDDALCRLADAEAEKDALALQVEALRARAEKAEKLLRSILCQHKGCREQAECFGSLNEGTHRKLVAGCKEHMPSLVRRRDAFAGIASSASIVSATLLATPPQEGPDGD